MSAQFEKICMKFQSLFSELAQKVLNTKCLWKVLYFSYYENLLRYVMLVSFNNTRFMKIVNISPFVFSM